MLSNYLINQKKFVVVIDNIGYEPKSQEIFQSWINKQNCESSVVELKSLNNPYEATDPNIEFYLLLPPLSKVILTNSIEEVIGSIKRAKENPKVQQVFQWVTLKNIQHPFVVQFVAHLADIILTFENEGHLNILTKKGGGSVSRKRYQYQIDEQTKTFNVKEVQLSKLKKQEDKPAINPHSLTTFKIGNLSVEEQKARDQVMLPYDKVRISAQRPSPAPEVSKPVPQIHYIPDAADDFDEEDPDDDLDI